MENQLKNLDRKSSEYTKVYNKLAQCRSRVMKRRRKLMRSLESDRSSDEADSTNADNHRCEKRIEALNELLASKDPEAYLRDLCQKSDKNEALQNKKRDIEVTLKSYLRLL